MFAVLAEDQSDVTFLIAILRRIRNDPRIPARGQGFEGCAHLLRKGSRSIRTLEKLGCSRFIVCHDADGNDPVQVAEKVYRQVVKPAGCTSFCIVVPVQEIEAWILADISKAQNLFSSWRPREDFRSPENVKSPKETLEKLSRDKRGYARYFHATHNEKMALHLDLDRVAERCPSFLPFRNFVTEAD